MDGMSLANGPPLKALANSTPVRNPEVGTLHCSVMAYYLPTWMRIPAPEWHPHGEKL